MFVGVRGNVYPTEIIFVRQTIPAGNEICWAKNKNSRFFAMDSLGYLSFEQIKICFGGQTRTVLLFLNTNASFGRNIFDFQEQ